MANLPAVIAASLKGRVVRKHWLVMLDFASGPMRVWSGYGSLNAGGYVWSGLGEMGSISGVEIPMGGTAPQTTLTLSGVDPSLVSVALGASADWKNRLVVISVQHFDAQWQTLDTPLAIYTGRMDKMQVSASAESRKLEISCEWLFSRRAIPAFTELTDADQKARFPGDRFCEFVPRMQNFVDKWPAR